MGRKTEIIDDDGNVLPPPEPGTDVSHAIYLLEYARKRGFRIGPAMKIGMVDIQVIDLRQTDARTRAQKDGMTDLEPGSDMALILTPSSVGDE